MTFTVDLVIDHFYVSPLILENSDELGVYDIKYRIVESSSQDVGIRRNTSLLHTTKSRITTNLKTVNNRKCQKIKLHGTLTTKELKKYSPKPTAPQCSKEGCLAQVNA